MTLKFPEVGDLFENRYELIEVLGSGGVGTVFKARQIESNRLIALKVLHPHKVIDDEFKLRFQREAQALNKLCHENIVTVYHLGLSEGALPYLAMELINGVSLRKALADAGRLPAHRIFKIMKQLCSALSCMHESGIIHRDLKPENIMLLQQPEPDTVKIIDFGLVKVDADSNQKLTATGLLIGSANYMSPEQCLGKRSDLRSDIYALAVCMYEMLAGEPPFTSDNPVGLMYKHANLPPPELRLQTGKLVHPAIREFVCKGLEKDPDLRFQTASEMDEALSKLAEHFGGEMPASAAPSRSPAGNPLVAALALLCCVVPFCVLFLLWTHHHSQVQPQGPGVTAFKDATARRDEREYKRLLARAEKTFGPDSLRIEDALADLANYYSKQQRFAEAEPLYKRLLAIREKEAGPNHASVGYTLDNLGECYLSQGNYGKAEPLCKRSLQIFEKALGPNHPDVAWSLRQLARVYTEQGKYTEAEPLYMRSLQIREEALGLNHPAVIQSLKILAKLHKQQVKYAESGSFNNPPLKLWQKELAQNQSHLAWDLLDLGAFYEKQRKYAEAEPLYKLSLEIFEKALGSNDINTTWSLNKLAELYRKQGKYAESELMCKRSLQIREKELGPNHPDLAQSFNNLAELYLKQGKYAESEPLFERSLQIREKALGPNHPDLARSLENYAELLRATKRETAAAKLEARAQAIRASKR